jgi:hypothetical protein
LTSVYANPESKKIYENEKLFIDDTMPKKYSDVTVLKKKFKKEESEAIRMITR